MGESENEAGGCYLCWRADRIQILALTLGAGQGTSYVKRQVQFPYLWSPWENFRGTVNY